MFIPFSIFSFSLENENNGMYTDHVYIIVVFTVYDVHTSLLVITGAGKTRSRDDDVIVSVTVDVSANHVTANMTSLSLFF